MSELDTQKFIGLFGEKQGVIIRKLYGYYKGKNWNYDNIKNDWRDSCLRKSQHNHNGKDCWIGPRLLNLLDIEYYSGKAYTESDRYQNGGHGTIP